MKVADLAAHVEALAAAHGIRTVESRGRGHSHPVATRDHVWKCCGLIAAGERVVRFRPVLSQRAYVVALHELGHQLGEYQARRHGRLAMELDATCWAWANTITRTAIVRAEILRHSAGYLDRYPSWPLPPAGHPVWRAYFALPDVVGKSLRASLAGGAAFLV